MNFLTKFPIMILVLLLLVNCSYEKINSPGQKKFFIQEINITGDTRSAFIIKKRVMRDSNKDSSNKIMMKVDLEENLSIVEKNIQNKVTKYKLSLLAKVLINDLNSINKFERNYNANSVYEVDERYSTTVENAKQAKKTAIESIANQILDDLKINYN